MSQRVQAPEATYEQLLALSPDAIFVWRFDTGIETWNRGAQELYGFGAEEARGRVSHELLHTSFPKPWGQVEAELHERKRWEGELVHTTKDGRTVTVSARLLLIVGDDGVERVLESNRDITERRRAEEETRRLLDAVRMEKDRLSALIDSIADEVWFADTQKQFTLVNPSAAREFGLGLSAGTGVEKLAGALEVLRPDGSLRPIEEAPPLRALGGEVVRNLEEIVRTPATGELRYREVSASPVRDARGEIIGAVSVVRDVTESKRAEEAVRQSEAKYRLLFRNMLGGFAHCRMLFDEQHRPVDFIYLDVNDAFARLTGLKDVAGKRVTEIIPGIRESNPELFEIYGRVASTGQSERFETWLEPLGIWLAVSVYSPRHEHFVAVFDNITERKQAEATLHESEERFRTMVNAIPQLAWIAKPDGYIFWYNQRWYEYTGTAPEQMEGWGWQSVHDPAALAEVLDRWKASIATGAPFDMVFPLRGADGRFRLFLTRVMPLKDAEGRVIQWFGTNTDVSERMMAEEALRESEERFRIMADSSPMVMWVTDHEGRVRFANRAYRAFFGVTLDDVEGGKWRAVIHPDDAPRYSEAFLGAVREQRPFNAEVRARRADGEWRWIATHAEPRFSSSGEFLGHVGVSPDITEHKQAEEALREADRRKNEFLGVLSHELRNPLAPIRNSLYILERAAPGGEQARRAHAVIERQVTHLARLVDDLLDVTRITRGKIRLQRTRLDLVDVVRRTVEDHRTVLQSHEVAVELPNDPIWVDGDATRLAQVIGNLLTNAAKFTPERGTVSVSLAQTQGHAVLEIADTGLGIDAETRERLFEPFAQADRSLDRSRGGLGLGLALVKGLVELHRGEVSAHSDGPALGTRFTITLPLDERTSVDQGLPQTHGSPGARRTILIIEDNMDAADSLSEALEVSGHRVAVAYSGDAGLAKAHDFKPDVVICDIGLPGKMDGYAVAGALRSDRVTASAYLVALTGYAQPEVQRRAINAGFDAHLAKPPDLAVLERLLAAAATTDR